VQFDVREREPRSDDIALSLNELEDLIRRRRRQTANQHPREANPDEYNGRTTRDGGDRSTSRQRRRQYDDDIDDRRDGYDAPGRPSSSSGAGRQQTTTTAAAAAAATTTTNGRPPSGRGATREVAVAPSHLTGGIFGEAPKV
jgi:hypothetical protein